MTGERPVPVPPTNPETEPFWDATADGRLLLRSCADCKRVYHYPRRQCPECASTNTDWTEASGRGTVYSYTVTRRASEEYADATPYVLAYVELKEGPRMLTNIVDCDIERVEVDSRVEVVFDDTGSGRALPRFTLRVGD
ncbi:Zn-ribbon domain-containing OB-fold protein [Natrinema caseinilyticum]|uniref:Zn-ribbon domain-containing OB-fold protein n=1 Tax=Natrinema caseinilyticum TaxID=2961570 RepID=UPI0020C258EE|nr:Zn-ribbon domain-containing OB-fold protein [Natrinema caseinilyticum]